MDESVIRLAFLCAGDPLDVLTWSGTPYHMLEALKREFNVVEVVRQPWPTWFSLTRKVLRRLTAGRVDIYWWPAAARLGAARTIATLKRPDIDFTFVVAASPIGAELVRRQPVAYVSDATFALMANYNVWLKRLAPPLKQSARRLESDCLQGAAATFLPSEWARNSAIKDHGGDGARIHVQPWGSNLIPENPTPPESRSKTTWRLLFIGTDWVGKGGDIALATIAEMRRRGHDVHLDIVGSNPGDTPKLDGITFHGFLDKRKPAEREKLYGLFRSAHAFFLPTKSEALGIVFAEAASYGLPAISYDTGGISAMVANGETGLLLDEGSNSNQFADTLIGLLGDWDGYVRMAKAAPLRSERVLNWPAWAREVRRTLTAVKAARTAA